MKSFTHPVVPNLYEVIQKKKKKLLPSIVWLHTFFKIFSFMFQQKKTYTGLELEGE